MVARPKIDRQVMRAHNRAVVLDVVRRSGPLARTEVARRTSLAKPTVSAIVDELLTEGLVHEVGVGKSTAAGGRPPTYLDFDVTRDAYVGVHVGVDETTVAVADGRGTIVASRSRTFGDRVADPLPRSRRSAARTTRWPRRASRARRSAHATIVLPGLVDRETGVCVLAPNLGWTDVPVAQLFGDALRVPVTVWNTPHASAFAESRQGAARDVDTFVWLYVGPGVGSAIVQDGELVTGTRGFAGEIGHCRVADDGPQCHCGKYGCLEVYTSAEAIGLAAARRRRAVARADAAVARRRAGGARRSRGRPPGARRRRSHARASAPPTSSASSTPSSSSSAASRPRRSTSSSNRSAVRSPRTRSRPSRCRWSRAASRATPRSRVRCCSRSRPACAASEVDA